MCRFKSVDPFRQQRPTEPSDFIRRCLKIFHDPLNLQASSIIKTMLKLIYSKQSLVFLSSHATDFDHLLYFGALAEKGLYFSPSLSLTVRRANLEQIVRSASTTLGTTRTTLPLSSRCSRARRPLVCPSHPSPTRPRSARRRTTATTRSQVQRCNVARPCWRRRPATRTRRPRGRGGPESSTARCLPKTQEPCCCSVVRRFS